MTTQTDSKDEQDLLILDDDAILDDKEGSIVNQMVGDQSDTKNTNNDIIDFDIGSSDKNTSSEDTINEQENKYLKEEENDEKSFDFSNLGNTYNSMQNSNISEDEQIHISGTNIGENQKNNGDIPQGQYTQNDNSSIQGNDFNLDTAIKNFITQLSEIKDINLGIIKNKESEIVGFESEIKGLRSKITALKTSIQSSKNDNERIDSKIGLLNGDKTKSFHKTRKKAPL